MQVFRPDAGQCRQRKADANNHIPRPMLDVAWPRSAAPAKADAARSDGNEPGPLPYVCHELGLQQLPTHRTRAYKGTCVTSTQSEPHDVQACVESSSYSRRS